MYEQTCEGCPAEWALWPDVEGYPGQRQASKCTAIIRWDCRQFLYPQLHAHLFNTQPWFSRLILSVYPALHSSLFPQVCTKHTGYKLACGVPVSQPPNSWDLFNLLRCLIICLFLIFIFIISKLCTDVCFCTHVRCRCTKILLELLVQTAVNCPHEC